MKGLRQHILDFEIIPTGNPETLVFIDSSDYYAEPERPLLEITLPGYKKYFLVNVVARRVNTFNSNTIGFSEVLNEGCLVDLPDGIYSFRYKICPYDKIFKDKKFFRTTLIRKRLADLYERLDAADCDHKDKINPSDLVEINALIEGAEAVVSKNEKKANSFYQLADKLISKLSDSFCNKNCK